MMELRKATYEDIPALIKCRIQQLNDEEEHPDIKIDETLAKWFKDMFDRDELVQFVLTEDDEIVSTGALQVLLMPPSFFKPTGRIGYVASMYTKKEYRKKGYATKILEAVKDEAVKRDCDKLFLEASVWGMPVYEKFGFEMHDAWMSYSLK